MNSVSKLIELLNNYPKDMRITNEQNEDFIHICNRQGNEITLSTKQPIGHCSNCGDYVYKEESLDYMGVCPTCDENKYDFEIEPLSKDKSTECL